MSWLRLATNPGQRAWGLRSCSNVSNTKAVFSGPGKRQPPRWYAFSRPRSVLMLLSLPSMCGKGEPSKRIGRRIYGIGTNISLKRLAGVDPNIDVEQLRYTRRRYLHKDH